MRDLILKSSMNIEICGWYYVYIIYILILYSCTYITYIYSYSYMYYTLSITIFYSTYKLLSGISINLIINFIVTYYIKFV